MARGYESKFDPPRGPDTKAKKHIRCMTRLYTVNLNYREMRTLHDLMKRQLELDKDDEREHTQRRVHCIERLQRVLAPAFRLATSHFLVTGDDALTEDDRKYYEKEKAKCPPPELPLLKSGSES